MAKKRTSHRPEVEESSWDDSAPEGEEEGVSLDQLTAAFAEVMATHAPAEAPPPNVEVEPVEEAPGAETETAPAWEGEAESELDLELDPAGQVTPQRIVEAMLFVGNQSSQPYSAEQMAALIRGVAPEEVEEIIGELNDEYNRAHAPYHIELVGTGYRMVLRREFNPVRNKFYGRLREVRLSQVSVDVLAVVAYNQPVTAEQVSKLRGAPSGSILSQLVRRRLLQIERQQEPQRVTLYRTTDRFLELFGLEDLEDLPRVHDLEPE